jgi:polysaccharide pyruvyl transferase WcaK-like protein
VRGNYGCRATSTALSLLVGREHTIVGRITGTHTHFDTDELFFVRGLPGGVYRFLRKMPMWKHVKTVLHLLFRMVSRGGRYYFGPFDFISTDLEKSIENLLRLIPANPAYAEFDLRRYKFDALVVNGEGSFIFSTPPWRESLVIAMEMYWALKMGKKVYFLNAMLSDAPDSPHNYETARVVDSLLARCEAVVVRERESLAYARKYLPSLKPRVYPDALFTWFELVNDDHRVSDLKYYLAHSAESDDSYSGFTFDKPYALIAGSSGGILRLDRREVVESYTRLVERTRDELKMDVYVIQVDEGDDFLQQVSQETGCPLVPMDTPILAAAKILANSRVFISGRYHPAIMASLGGTPCVFLASNSHKTHSIQEVLGYDQIHEFPVVPDPVECERIVDLARQRLAEGERLRDTIRSRSAKLAIEAASVLELLRDHEDRGQTPDC